MNIQSVSVFNSAIEQLNAISGDITSTQLSSLTELFSTQLWNTSDSESTLVTLDKQIMELEALLDEVEAEINKLYYEQKSSNQTLNSLVNQLNDESYQASKQADKNIQQQQDAVETATDDAYIAYLQGKIEKDEIPNYIASLIGRSNSSGGAALSAHLSAMDSTGQKITDLSNKIASILDSINKSQSKYNTTEASHGLLKQLKTMVPEHKSRNDIQQNIAQPYYSPSQEAMGDKLIDAYRVENKGSKSWANGDESTDLMAQGLQGSGVVDEARKMELDAMSAEEKASAVEEADTGKYSVPELLYISGMDKYQAAAALDKIFGGAGIGYDTTTGGLRVPRGHTATRSIYNELKNQYTTLWGDGVIQDESETDEGVAATRDPIGWRNGDTNYMFALDRDGDNLFDGYEEFVGANGDGWSELVSFDANGDGMLTADEMAAGGVRVVEVNQSLTNGGTYGFNGVKEAGVDYIDLNSYAVTDAIKSTNLNGNTRVGEFTMSVNGQSILGKQTENQEAYNEAFYGHIYNEAYSFGLDSEQVSATLSAAASGKDFTAAERAETENAVQNAQNIIDTDASNLETKYDTADAILKSADNNRGQGLYREEDDDEDADEVENEETATSTTDTTATTSTAENITDTTPTSNSDNDLYLFKI